MLRVSSRDAARFWVKAAVGDVDECWPWTAGRFPKGYGAFQIANRAHRAQRVALALSGVDVPAGAHVCHHCDNPPCVNPRHLFLGTAADNQRDCVAKDRHSRGSRNGIAKLTEEQVLEIRRRLAAGEGQTALAREFGVIAATVHHIAVRRNWRHI